MTQQNSSTEINQETGFNFGFSKLMGTTPPKKTVALSELQDHLSKYLNSISSADIDGFVVYDVQDEQSRTNVPRPFPYQPCHDSAIWAQKLTQATQLPCVVYKSIQGLNKPLLEQWLFQCQESNLNHIVLVGGASESVVGAINLNSAIQLASSLGFLVGSVVIAERHETKKDEPARMNDKSKQGSQYFISQTVYDLDLAKTLLRDYAAFNGQTLLKSGDTMKPILFSFSPCGSAKTLEFIKWLGIKVDDALTAQLLGADDILQASVDLAVANFAQLKTLADSLNIQIGVNVESLTHRKVEVDAANELTHRLAALIKT